MARTLRDWFIYDYVLNGTLQGTGGLVDGVFFDDDWNATTGPSEASVGLLNDTGLTPTAVQDISIAYTTAIAEVLAAVISAGGFSWQSFYNNGTVPAPLVRASTCLADLRTWCSPSSPASSRAILFGFTGARHSQFNSSYLFRFQQDLVNFLLIRGDYAWLGYGWTGVNSPYYRPPELDIDYGVPTEVCHETELGVFSRRWTKAVVTMDCALFEGKIVMINSTSTA